MKGFVFQDDPERSVLHRPIDPAKEAIGARSSRAYATSIVYSVPIEEVGYCKRCNIALIM
jgi:hypothetical protein